MGRIILILVIVFSIGLLVWSRLGPRSTGEHIVQLNENGFSPAELIIHQGDIVRFTTTRGKEFWPASDLHPSHEVYPEFDPRKPVAPDQSWTFRFDRKGSWRFHDHLAPLFRGTITVR